MKHIFSSIMSRAVFHSKKLWLLFSITALLLPFFYLYPRYLFHIDTLVVQYSETSPATQMWTPTNDTCQIKGETLSLRGQTPTQLMYLNACSLSVYGLTPTNDTVKYTEHLDYIVSKQGINRALHSRIPDFSNHQVIFNDAGKFQFVLEPRNPELSLPYQVYCDYTYTPSKTRTYKSLMPKSLKSNIDKGKTIHISIIGTSISFGAHTHQRFFADNDSQTYHQLIAKALRKIYNVDVICKNNSIDGGGINQLESLSNILKSKPDILILEIGMNDHLGSFPKIRTYKQAIESTINVCQNQGIEVILVGFFQQLDSWKEEYPSKTIEYNAVLYNLSKKHNLYFADIYKTFEKINKQKIYQDYMGDYMHHPTSFGHQLYYLELMPFFIDKQMSQDELLKHLY